MASSLAIAALCSGNALAEELALPTSATAGRPAPPKQLDLRPPNITHLFTSEQLNRIISATFRADLEEIQVEGARDRVPPSTPEVWSGIGALAWAVVNPAEAWRILAPLPPDQTRGMRNVRYDATDSYVLEPAGIPSPHAQ